jgi:F0F1-type ATP synthase assembly protein I
MVDKPPRGADWGEFWKVGGISFTVAILIGAGAAGGVVLDRKFGTKPIFSLILLFVGLVTGGYYAYKSLMEMLK